MYKQSCFWPRRTAQNHLKIPAWRFLACQLQWWWLEVCLTKTLWDIVCILLNNGNFQNNPHLGILPHTPLLALPFTLPRWNWSLLKYTYPWPSHKKRVWSENWQNCEMSFFLLYFTYFKCWLRFLRNDRLICLHMFHYLCWD